MTAIELVLAGAAAFVAGMLNALAGGGTLVTYPTLVALGVLPLAANASSTVALASGFLGATLAQRRDLAGQGRRIAMFVPLGLLGGAGGALLLLHSEESLGALIPWLILAAALLIGFQVPLRAWFSRRVSDSRSAVFAVALVIAAAVYGGYFGAGFGVMLVAGLGITLPDDITRVSALKQIVATAVNTGAATVLAVAAPIVWDGVAVMAATSILGGLAGGALSTHIPVRVLRAAIVVLGVTLAVYYFIRG